MSIQFSPVVATKTRGNGSFSVSSLDLGEIGKHASPLALLDDFRVSGRPFGPHPHAGFSQLTYVFEDSLGAVRSRDSLGNDLVVGPGGIVWTQAGSGMMHQEVPADPKRELHGLQVFVNLSAKNKLITPKVLHLASEQVPEWKNGMGDRVRVVVGSFERITSPLLPAEPFTFLDVTLRHGIDFDLLPNHNAVIYVLNGLATIDTEDCGNEVPAAHAIALFGTGGHVRIEGTPTAHLLTLSGPDLREPVIAEGPFIMNDQVQIEAAFARFRAGAMGQLAPLENV